MRCGISFIKEMNVFKHKETTSGPDLYVDCICQDWPTPPLGDLTLVYYQINNFKRRMQNLVKHFKMELFAKFQVDRCCFAFFLTNAKGQHLKRQPHKTIKHTQKIRRLQPRICLSVFDHLWGWRLNGQTRQLLRHQFFICTPTSIQAFTNSVRAYVKCSKSQILKIVILHYFFSFLNM